MSFNGLTAMTEIARYSDTSIVQAPQFHSERGASIESVIGAWLASAKREKTKATYKITVNHFRSILQEHGIDLFFPDPQTIADAAQIFQTWRSPGSHRRGDVSENTQAQRMFILSSFYKFAIRRGHLKGSNPIDLLEVPHIEAYTHAEAIEQEELKARLAAIPTDTLEGMQARAILAVFLYTGWRANEVMKLTRKDVRLSGKVIKLNVQEAKGGKQFRDELDSSISIPLAQWLHAFYGPGFWFMPDNTPLWVQLYHESGRGDPLGYQGIRGIVSRYLGTSRVHVTRHSATLLLVLAGATEREIQERLHHSNIATTNRYLPHIKAAENKHGAKVAELLGFREEKK